MLQTLLPLDGMDFFNHPLFALTLFAFVSSITPGPNNLMLLASGVNFGFKATIPHMLGIGIGFGIMLLAVAMGFMQAFTLVPWLRTVMKWAGIAYLTWMALGLVRAAHEHQSDLANGENSKKVKPMSFFAAAAFQWINPKAWWMVVSMGSTYLPADPSLALLLLAAGIFVVVNIPTVSLWTYMGTHMRRWLSNRKQLLFFNYTMAILLMASLLPIVFEK
jgi:threonine/homoserine/homoserine lactone efflux protein